jgi:hypothetical protein
MTTPSLNTLQRRAHVAEYHRLSLLSLPDDMLGNIARFLSETDLVSFSQTCQAAKSVAFNERFSRIFYATEHFTRNITDFFQEQSTPNPFGIHAELINKILSRPLNLQGEKLHREMVVLTAELVAQQRFSVSRSLRMKASLAAYSLELDLLGQAVAEIKNSITLAILGRLSRFVTIEDRSSLLNTAVFSKNQLFVEILLSNGIILQESRGHSLVLAAGFDCPEIVRMLLESGDVLEETKKRALKLAATRGFLHVVANMLFHGISDDCRGKAVFEATVADREDVVRMLIESGPIFLIDRDRAMDCATLKGSSIAKALEKATVVF